MTIWIEMFNKYYFRDNVLNIFVSLNIIRQTNTIKGICKCLVLLFAVLSVIFTNPARAQLEDGLFQQKFESYKSFDNLNLESTLSSPTDNVEKMVVWVTLILRKRDNGLADESYQQSANLFKWLLETKDSQLIWAAYRKIIKKFRALEDFKGIEGVYDNLVKQDLSFDPYLAFKLPYTLSIQFASFAKFQTMYEMLEPTLTYMDDFSPTTTEETLTLAGAFHNYGQVLIRRKRFVEAIDYFFKSERIYQNTEAISHLVFIPHAVLGEGYLKIKDYEKAEFYSRLSLKNFLKERIDGRIFVMSNLATALLEQGHLDEAIEVLNEAGTFLDKTRKDYRIYYYFALTEVQLGYKSYEAAHIAANEAMVIATALGDDELLVEAMHKKGLTLSLTTDPEGGEALIFESITKAETGINLSAEKPYKSLVYLYESQGKFEEALEAHKKLKFAVEEATRQINFSVVADLEAVKALRENNREKERLIEEEQRKGLALEVSQRENQVSRLFNFSLILGAVILIAILIGLSFIFKILRKSNRELERISTEDLLTKLKNRRFIKIFMEEESKRLDRSGEKALFILADLDRLSSINDTHSFETGNDVIIQAAKILKASLRSEDIVSRWGGGKFLIICRNPDDDFAATICKRILNTFSKCQMGSPNDPFTVTISLGLTNFFGASRGLDWKASTHIADAALRDVKAKGGNHWQLKD